MAQAAHPSSTPATSPIVPASFHLLRYPAGRPAREARSRIGRDRPELLRTPGLRFFQLLGTGEGSQMTLSVDLRRWACLAFWRHSDDMERFIAASPVSRRWDDLGAERYDLRLSTVRARGTWSRAHFDVQGAASIAPDDPVAILTRAALRPSRVMRFWRSIPNPSADLAADPNVLASVGMGEVPIVRQATFSLWRDLASVQDYAYRRGPHREVIARTRAEDWYSSELFARFRVDAASGTWDGRDPLAASGVGAAGGTR